MINRPLLSDVVRSWDALWPLPLWRGGRCKEVKIRVNANNLAAVERWPLVGSTVFL